MVTWFFNLCFVVLGLVLGLGLSSIASPKPVLEGQRSQAAYPSAIRRSNFLYTQFHDDFFTQIF